MLTIFSCNDSTSSLPNAEEISAQLCGGGNDDEDEVEEMKDVEKDEENTTAAAENDAKQTAPSSSFESKQHESNTKPQSVLQTIQSSQRHTTFNTEEIEVSCINPRGKFHLSIYNKGLIFINPKKPNEEQIPIAASSIKHVVWFRKPEDYKKMKQLSKNGGGKGKNGGVPGHMVLICLKEEEGEGVMFRNKVLLQVCFQLPNYPSSSTDENNEGGLTEKNWWDGLSSSLFTDSSNGNGIIRVGAKIMEQGNSGYVFQSEGIHTTEGMPYVGCYYGFNDGVLFPLKEGLLFFK